VKSEDEEQNGECFLTIDEGRRRLVGESSNSAGLYSACSPTVYGVR